MLSQLGKAADLLPFYEHQRRCGDVMLVLEGIRFVARSEDMLLDLELLAAQKITRSGAKATGVTGQIHSIQYRLGHGDILLIFHG